MCSRIAWKCDCATESEHERRCEVGFAGAAQLAWLEVCFIQAQLVGAQLAQDALPRGLQALLRLGMRPSSLLTDCEWRGATWPSVLEIRTLQHGAS